MEPFPGLKSAMCIFRRILLGLCVPLVFLLPSFLHAASVSLAWDPSVSPNISGYRVYLGLLSRIYQPPIEIGNQTTYTVTGLGPGTWFFAVTAFDVDGNESDFSNEVSETIAPPAPAFQITSMSASQRWFGVVFLATTSQKASAIFHYSKVQPGAGWTTVIATVGAFKTQHRVVLYLPMDSGYWNYQWTATAADGTVATGSSTFQVP